MTGRRRERYADCAGLIALATAFVLSCLIAAIDVDAQLPAKTWRIGVLEYDASPTLDQLRAGRRQLGYVESQSIMFELRDAEGRSERLPRLAADLVQLRVDVIVARGTAAARAAKNATGTIPIVMAPSDDPVRTGLITSLARPGGNVTGVSVLSWETEPKRLQLLKEVVPRLARAGILWTPGNPGHSLTLKEIEAPARSLGLQLHPVAVRTPDELTGAFRNMVAAHVGGAIVLGDSMLFSQRERIIDLASRHRLPVMYFRRDFAEVGGLMSYGTEVNELVRRAAYFVDRILKGTTPADLPVEQPTKFELVINLKTAKALGLTIPQSVLGQADHVIK